jgi:hypothetical protein
MLNERAMDLKPERIPVADSRPDSKAIPRTLKRGPNGFRMQDVTDTE